MLSLSCTRFVISRRLIRGIALMFLIYTAMDLAAPGVCRGEALGDGRPGLVAAAKRPTNQNTTTSIGHKESTSNQPTNEPSERPSDDDDCFCCCSHVIPGSVIGNIAVTDIRSISAYLEYVSVPSPPLARTFHPPRFA